MLKNYLKTAFRNLSRNKEYAITNILGLAVGIGVCILIFLVIRFETSFDNFHSKKDRIYRVVSLFHTPQGLSHEPGVPFPTGPALRHDYPQLPGVASILSVGGDGQINVLDNSNETHSLQKFKENNGIVYAEPQFFQIFDFKWLAGDKQTSLRDPNMVLLTKAMAEKYFGSWQAALGRLIRLDNSWTLKVSGILDDLPANTDFPLKVVISYSTLKNTGLNGRLTDWGAIFAQHYCFVILPDNMSEQSFNRDLAEVVTKYKPVESRNEGMVLLPLRDMHFDTRYSTFNNHKFSRDLILTLSLVGIFVLIIACVNFVNLATAQAINRAKEAGLRKVMGSTRGQLLWQFLSEAALLVIVATFIAIGICMGTLSFFNNLLGIAISHGFIFQSSVLEILLLIVIGTTLLAGFYPAVVISGFSPISALRNKTSVKNSGAGSLRRVLVVLQFTISQSLIICVLIVVGQMNYFRSTPMGFDKDQIMITHIPDNSNIQILADRLRQIAGIEVVSFSYASPIDNNNWNSDIEYNGEKKKDFGANLKWADTAFPATYNLKLLAGRFYSQSDTIREIVVNNTFLIKLGIRDPQSAIGAKVRIGDGSVATVTGIVKDFNIASLHDVITPVIMGPWRATYSTVNIKVQQSKVNQIIQNVQETWKATFPDNIFEYHFLDDNIAAYYKQEEQLSALYKMFAGIAIFISCLGLYSLISFVVVQRAKEVGIRKTLGASVANIVFLFSKEFIVLILIGFSISVPIAWYFMHQWLQNYAYHIEPGPAIFSMAIVISLVIAGLSVGYKAIRAATVNPVKSLKES